MDRNINTVRGGGVPRVKGLMKNRHVIIALDPYSTRRVDDNSGVFGIQCLDDGNFRVRWGKKLIGVFESFEDACRARLYAEIEFGMDVANSGAFRYLHERGLLDVVI